MKNDHTPNHDPLRNETPGLGPAVERHDLSQDISGMRTDTWAPRPRQRAKWPLWLGGLAVVGVAAAMMFDMAPGEKWVSAHLDRPAPESESVPLPLPSQPTPQAQTDLPAMPPVAQAEQAGEQPPRADRDAAPAPPAAARPQAEPKAEPRNRAEPKAPTRERSTEPSGSSVGALPATPAPVTPEPTPPAPEPSVSPTPAPIPTPTPSEPAPVPADPKPQPVDPAAPSGT